jgi:hypothetical protein
VRSYLTRIEQEAIDGDHYNLVSSTIVAETMDSDDTASNWSYTDKKLTADFAATIDRHVLGKIGVWESTITRIYKVNPRPFSKSGIMRFWKIR